MHPTGTVYDRGYRRYEGARRGRRATVAALHRMSMRRALGFGRSWRKKVFPWLLLVVVTIPAAINVGIAYVARNVGDEPVELFGFREYVGVSTSLLLFVAITAPDVICPDLRQRVLPLIFARPLSGNDYVLAKVGAIATIVFAFAFLPQVFLFVGQMLVSDGALDYVQEHAAVLWQVPVAVTVLALYWAALGVAVASFTTRRVIAGVMILGLALVTSTIAGVATAASADGHPLAVVNLASLPLHIRDLIFLGDLSDDSDLSGVANGGLLAVIVYVAIVGGALAVLLRRYRYAEARS